MPQWNVGKAIIHYQTVFLDTAQVELLNGPVYDINLRCESMLKNTLFLLIRLINPYVTNGSFSQYFQNFHKDKLQYVGLSTKCWNKS